MCVKVFRYISTEIDILKLPQCTTVENLIANDVKDTRLLRVAPLEGCKIALPMVNLGEYLTSNSLSLNSYEKRLGLKSSRVDLLGSVQHLKGIGKKGIKRYKLDKKVLNRTDENCALPDTSSDMDLLETGNSVSEKAAIINNIEKSSSEQHSEPSRFPGRETVDRIRRGWNVEEANTITMGDLFLMVRDVTLILEIITATWCISYIGISVYIIVLRVLFVVFSFFTSEIYILIPPSSFSIPPTVWSRIENYTRISLGLAA